MYKLLQLQIHAHNKVHKNIREFAQIAFKHTHRQI